MRVDPGGALQGAGQGGGMIRRAQILLLLKLALVAAILAFVFASLQWRDTWTRTAGSAHTVTKGKILGPWDVEVVRFRTDDGVEHSVRRSAEAAEGAEHVSAGFLTYLRNLDPVLFGIGCLCFALSVATGALRWWWLLHINELPIGRWQALRFTWIGLFSTNFLPGLTGGDLVKALYVMKHSPAARVRALVSVIVDRVMGLGSLALLGAVIVLFQLDRFATLALGIWGVLLGVGFLGCIAFSRRLRRLIHLDDLLNLLPARISGLLKRIDEAVFFYRQHKLGIGAWMLLGVLNHAVSVTSCALIGMSLGVGVPVVEYFVLVPIINTISAIPITPNGWGIGEGLYRFLFGKYCAVYLGSTPNAAEVIGTRAVALSVLHRIQMTLWSLLGGVFLVLDKDRVTRAEVEAEVERERAEGVADSAGAGR
jgi:uncharacterized protein (TIRG00374 family)